MPYPFPPYTYGNPAAMAPTAAPPVDIPVLNNDEAAVLNDDGNPVFTL